MCNGKIACAHMVDLLCHHRKYSSIKDLVFWSPHFFPPLCLEARQLYTVKFNPGPILGTPSLINITCVHLIYSSVYCNVLGHLLVQSFCLSASGTPNCESALAISGMGDKGLNLPVRQVEPAH